MVNMSMSRELPEYLQEKILNMPEFSYGVNRVVVTLDDGSEISDVYVAWGKEIIKVGSSDEINFDASRIVDVSLQM
jgi:hypothetical protein